mgnify:CR=1 FL=1
MVTRRRLEAFPRRSKAISYAKGFETVTTVNLHSDTIQIINEYERNLYFDIDYRTDTSDTLTIKAVCDTYQESDQMRFGLKYNTEQGGNDNGGN